MNEIVKYHNELNTVPFKRFNPREMNLFFSIVSRMRDEGTSTVRFQFEELRDLSQYSETSIQRFVNDLESTYDKMLVLTVGSRTKLNIRKFVLFTGFEISGEDGYVDIRLNPDLKSILNELDTWTRFSLQQFNALHSTYAKTLFRLLKQYRTTGRLEISMEDFKELFEVPKSYTKASHIDRKILNPAINELSPYFPGLKLEKKKSAKGKGRKILSYIFTFQEEERNSNDFIKVESQRQPNKKTEQAMNFQNQEQEKNQKNEELTERERFEAMLAERRQKKSSQS